MPHSGPARNSGRIETCEDHGRGRRRWARSASHRRELLASFRVLPAASLHLDDLWAEPQRRAAAAARWAERLPVSACRVLDAVPGLFAGRPVVLTHGDFAPVNILTDGTAVTGLLDLEAVRLADPLFDPAWWAWSVSFSGPGVLETACRRSWRARASTRPNPVSANAFTRCRCCA